MTNFKGFTLVEITIVLVVVGLLLGGILKGKEIIFNAKVKNLESNLEEIRAAIYTYQERYRALPGDDPTASRKFGRDITVSTSKGDGRINGIFQSTTDSDESRIAWTHLRAAEMVVGSPTSFEQPLNVFYGISGISSEISALGGRSLVTLSGVFIGFTQIPQKAAVILESRLDDNQPHTGAIQTDSPNGYDDGSSIEYNVFCTI
ncbi:MAG: hypothetical protein BWK79_07105 [Beggiatoa sp. IS2]|nr:MAG: hypothetical protein BWK79_07105 [Beggiatoa sp. IS2]